MSKLTWSGKKNIAKRPQNVVFALDADIAEKTIQGLKGLPNYDYSDEKKWEFEICASADELKSIDHSEVDVLVFYLFLEGETPAKTIKYVAENFLPGTHVVVITGKVNEEVRNYIKKARENKLHNFVTGDELPGDPPYYLELAIQHTYDQVIKCELDEKEIEDEKKDSPADGKNYKGRIQGRRPRGMEIAFCGSKGGIGKSTGCAAIAIALSKAGIKVTVADADFSRADQTAFFKINPQFGGIDQIDPEMITPAALENLLVPVPSNQNIQVLPGPEDKFNFDSSIFSDNDILKIMDSLTGTADFVLVDTPSSLDDRRNPAIMANSDIIVVILDQSAFTLQDCRDYGEYLAQCGIDPKKIRLMINKYSKKLHPVNKIAKAFNEGLGSKGIAPVALIQQDWDAFVIGLAKSTVPWIDDPKGPWQKLAANIATTAGVPYNGAGVRNTAGKGLFGFSFFRRAQ